MVREKSAPSGRRVINEELGIDWSNWDAPAHLAYSQRAMPDFWPTAIIRAPELATPLIYAGNPLDIDSLQIPEPGTDRVLSANQLLNYVVALALYNFVWNFSLAFQYAAVNAADTSGRSVAAAPAFHAAGGAVGPGVAALIMTTGSFTAVLVLAAGAVIVSFLMFAFSVENRSKAATSQGRYS
jgi:hypothetical protein